MGYDITRFIGEVDEELICCICKDVLKNPTQCSICEHVYCNDCVTRWISYRPTCPISSHPMRLENLSRASRLMRNLLGRLKIKCTFAANGCQMEVTLDHLEAHEGRCEKNPSLMVASSTLVPRSESVQHSRLTRLRNKMEQQREKIQQLQCKQGEQVQTINIHANELENIHYFLSSLRYPIPLLAETGEHCDRFCLIKWGQKLPVAVVLNWDNFIFRPDHNMLVDLDNSLRTQGSPMQLIQQMVNSSHMATSPLVLDNFGLLRDGKFRLLQPLNSGEQCVLVLKEENTQLPANFMRQALIMLFEDGVERAAANGQSDGTATDSNEGVDGDDDAALRATRPMMSVPNLGNVDGGSVAPTSLVNVAIEEERESGSSLSSPGEENNSGGNSVDIGFNVDDDEEESSIAEESSISAESPISEESSATDSSGANNENDAVTPLISLINLVSIRHRASGAPRVLNNDGGATNTFFNGGTPVLGLQMRRNVEGEMTIVATWQRQISVPREEIIISAGNGEHQGNDSGNDGDIEDEA